MAKADNTPGKRRAKSTICQERRIKVHQGRYSRTLKDKDNSHFDRQVDIPVPWLNIKGLWLEQAGFEINTPVKIRVMDGCLVLTKEENN